jgi:hypothetical protein
MRWLVILSFLLNCRSFAQSDHFWAIPAQGASRSIYRSTDTTSAVVASITSDDVLLVRPENSTWYWAQDANGRQGFMQRSHVRPLTELDDQSAVRWMHKVFEEEERLGRQINERFLAGDSVGTQAAGGALNDLDYERNAALSLFITYFCRTGDKALLLAMMKSVAANSGSASEDPPYGLTLALECRPAEFKRTLASMDSGDAGVVIEATSNGLWLRYDEKDPEQVKQREALMTRLHE